MRVDDLDPSDALEEISSEFGRGTSALTADGSGSLIRFRIPVEKTPFELVDVLKQSRIGLIIREQVSDIGPIPAVSEDGRISFSESRYRPYSPRGIPHSGSRRNRELGIQPNPWRMR